MAGIQEIVLTPLITKNKNIIDALSENRNNQAVQLLNELSDCLFETIKTLSHQNLRDALLDFKMNTDNVKKKLRSAEFSSKIAKEKFEDALRILRAQISEINKEEKRNWVV